MVSHGFPYENDLQMVGCHGISTSKYHFRVEHVVRFDTLQTVFTYQCGLLMNKIMNMSKSDIATVKHGDIIG
jgi:hypothetical protein